MVENGFGYYRGLPVSVKAKQMSENFLVDTPEGRMIGEAGDYLVIVDGEQYPVKKGFFEKIYCKDNFRE